MATDSGTAGELRGRVALITGAGSGIGRATCLLFARRGAVVACSDVDAESGAQTARTIQDLGGEASFHPADVSVAGQVEDMVASVLRRHGGLDIAFNNAGIGGLGKPTDEHTLEEYERTMAVNTKGVFLGMKYQIPPMLERGGGAIVNTASMVGLVGMAGLSAYVASKHAVVGLTRSAALEYGARSTRSSGTSSPRRRRSGCPSSPSGATASPRRSQRWWPGSPRTRRRSSTATR